MSRARQEYEFWLRTSTDGLRDYTHPDNEASGATCDPLGHIMVSPAGLAGLDVPANSATAVAGRRDWVGSAPQYDNLGLVQTARVLQRPNAFTNSGGVIWCIRMFGYAEAAGWVQLILKNEAGGANPPVLGDVPEVTISVGAAQNFVFGNWPLTVLTGGAIPDLATYIAFSTTGPTYTPGGANLWFAYLGAL